MKRVVRNILNEAKRTERTIDPKIWASMSSMSSRLRSTLGEDAKPMKKDVINVLLQKYVAGLLTMKVACPNNVSEIDDLKAYKQIGMAYINAGGTISQIQKLYVENGGKLSDGATINNEPVIDNVPDEIDDTTDDIFDEPDEEYPAYDEVELDEPVEDTEIQDYPAYDEVEIEDNTPVETPKQQVKNKEVTRKVELSNTQKYINTYLKGNRDILSANPGTLLVFDENSGLFVIDNKAVGEYPVCTGRGYSNIDKKTRFFVISKDEYELGNAGNNGVYDDYYFKKDVTSQGRLSIKPGSNYYEDEVTKGKFYTEMLADNGMVPAMHVENVVGECSIEDPNAMEVLKYSSYLPTLPELAKIMNVLPSGTYWTSSVSKNGTANIALQVNPDKVLANCTSAKVIAFIRFD